MFFADTFKLFRKWLTFRPVCAASLFRSAALIWTLVISIIGFVCVLTGVYIYGSSVVDYAMVLLSGLFLLLVLISLAALRRARKDQKAAGIKLDKEKNGADSVFQCRVSRHEVVFWRI